MNGASRCLTWIFRLSKTHLRRKSTVLILAFVFTAAYFGRDIIAEGLKEQHVQRDTVHLKNVVDMSSLLGRTTFVPPTTGKDLSQARQYDNARHTSVVPRPSRKGQVGHQDGRLTSVLPTPTRKGLTLVGYHHSNVRYTSLPPPVHKSVAQAGYYEHNGADILTLRVSSPHGTEDNRTYPSWVNDIGNYLWNKSVIPQDKLDWYYELMIKDVPLGTWPEYDYGPLKEMLKPAYDKTKEDGLKVPPLVHFTWFYGTKRQEMKFYTMLSLLAAHKKIKPYKILFWYDIMPVGEWWDYAVRHIPSLLMVYRETPQKIFNTTISIPEHRSDVTRVEAVLTLGGIYLDLDSIPLNSIDPLRNYSAVQAGTLPYSLANAVIIGAPNNLFHWLFYLNYLRYQNKAWASNSVLKGMELAKKYPKEIYVEYSYIFRPNIPERFYYFRDGWLWNWALHYTIHLFARFNSHNYEYHNIHKKNNVIGEIYRHLLRDEVIPDIDKRPSLFEMSWWHYKDCRKFPKGTWDCKALASRFLELNQTYHFHPG